MRFQCGNEQRIHRTQPPSENGIFKSGSTRENICLCVVVSRSHSAFSVLHAHLIRSDIYLLMPIDQIFSLVERSFELMDLLLRRNGRSKDDARVGY